jgi:hypothetical protein
VNASNSGMSDDRKKLFNTFMKEMNHSLVNYNTGGQSSNSKKKKQN